MRDIDYRIWELAGPYLNIRKNDIHVQICCSYALKLLEFEQGEHDVVIPAILCHDVGWIKVPEELHLKAFGPTFDPELARLHEVEGVKVAREILLEVNYEPKKVAEILEIIDGHDTRLSALSLNDKIVKDADKLFRFDPIGLKIDAERFKVDQNHHVNYLQERIESWLFTETAKRFAREELVRSRVNEANGEALV